MFNDNQLNMNSEIQERNYTILGTNYLPNRAHLYSFQLHNFSQFVLALNIPT